MTLTTPLVSALGSASSNAVPSAPTPSAPTLPARTGGPSGDSFGLAGTGSPVDPRVQAARMRAPLDSNTPLTFGNVAQLERLTQVWTKDGGEMDESTCASSSLVAGCILLGEPATRRAMRQALAIARDLRPIALAMPDDANRVLMLRRIAQTSAVLEMLNATRQFCMADMHRFVRALHTLLVADEHTRRADPSQPLDVTSGVHLQSALHYRDILWGRASIPYQGRDYDLDMVITPEGGRHYILAENGDDPSSQAPRTTLFDPWPGDDGNAATILNDAREFRAVVPGAPSAPGEVQGWDPDVAGVDARVGHFDERRPAWQPPSR